MHVISTTRCATCGGSLDLPAVHFMCKHSYHERCLPESNNANKDQQLECPQCAAQNTAIRAIKRTQEDLANRHDVFKAELRDSSEKFKTVTDFFAKGVMSVH